MAVEFLGLFVPFVHNLLQLHMHTLVFSPIKFLCILLLEERFVQEQALQQRVPGPNLPYSSPSGSRAWQGQNLVGVSNTNVDYVS